MDAFHQYDDVVNQIYDSALHPTRWPIAFDGARRLLGCDVFHAFAWDRTAKVPKVTWASVSASEGMHRSYNEYFGRIDPRRELSDALTPGQMMACNHTLAPVSSAAASSIRTSSFQTSCGTCSAARSLEPRART